MKLKRKILMLLALVLTFSALFATASFSTSAAEGDHNVTIDGKNYTIPADKIVSGAKAAVFAREKDSDEYTFLKTITAVANVFSDEVQKPLSEKYPGGEIYMYLLSDVTEARTSGWNNGFLLNGTFTLDLGGHTYTNTTAPRLIGFLSAVGAEGYESTFRMKNGTFSTSKVISEVWAEKNKYTGTKTCNVIFDDVTIHSTASSYTLFNAKTSSSGSFSDTMTVNFNVTLNNCTFDMPNADPVTIISDTNPAGHVKCNVNINNPIIKAKRFAASNGKSTDSAVKMNAEDSVTLYLKDYDTAITESYASSSASYFTSDKKFIVLGKKSESSNYSVIGTYGTYNGMIGNVYNNLKTGGAYAGGELVTYMLVDQSWTGTGSNNSGGWNEAANLNGTYTFDLGGHIFDASAPRAFGFLATTDTCNSTVVVKNGTFRTSKVIAEVWTEGATYTGTKNCSIIFNDLTIIRSGSPTAYSILGTKTNSSAGFSDTMKVNFNAEFNNCTIDYSTATDFKLINDAITLGTVECNVTVKGGNISAKTSFIPIAGANENDSCVFVKTASGERTTIVYDYTTDCSEITFMTDNGEMHLAATSVASRTMYALSDLYIDGYGYIPTTETNKTFSVFDVERKLHLGSYDSYANGAVERVRTITNSFATSCSGLYQDGAVTVLLRKDYSHTDSWYGNYAHISGTFTLDLGGHTITQTSNGLFNFISKKTTVGSNPSILNVTTTIVKNGTILTRNMPVVKVNNNRSTGNFDYEGTKEFNITFEGVTFDKYWAKNDKIETYSPIVYVESDGDLGVDVNAVFNDCSFTTCNSAIIDAALSNYANVNAVINGGVINTNDMNTFDFMKASDENDTLTFGKGENGKYPALVLPTSAAAPTESYNDGKLVFVKVEDGAETTTYRLRDRSVEGITYSPKMSITLDRNLYINVYIPTESLVSFTFDCKSYASLDDAKDLIKTVGGKSYYVFSTPLPSSEAARELTLTVTLNDGEKTATGSFTFSIPKYAKKVLGAGTLVEKQVVRDTLSYIRAAIVYFDAGNAKAISDIDSIIGKNYDVTSPVTYDGSTDTSSEGLLGATLNLDATPGIRFYIDKDANASDYTFFRIENGKEIALDIEEGTDANGRYLEIDVYAYAMCKTVYYRTAGGASGNYHIASYHAWAKTQKDANLINLVERFWKYAESANDYKNAVTVTVNYVDSEGNTLAGSKAVTKAPGAEVSFASPAIAGYYTRQLYVYSSATANENVNVVYYPIPTNVDPAVADKLLADITAWGDSITEGSNSGNVNAANDHGIDLEALGSTKNGGSYRTILKALIESKVYSSITVYNLGVGSETSATIAARANTENYYFYINTAATVTDAPIVLDLQQNKGLDLDGRLGVLRRTDTSGGGISQVYMTGKDENGNEVTVPGILTCVADEGQNIVNCDYKYLTYTFTRTDGKTDKVIFDKDTRVVTSASVHLDGNTCIIFMGENGGYNKDNATLIAQQEEILKACGNPEFFLIISSTSKTTADRQSLNDALEARWGINYINAGNLLSSSRYSYDFVGYSEEAIVKVLDNIIEGSVTELMLADSCHPNAVGYAVIANAMFERLFELGAFDAIFDYYDSLR